MYINNNYSNTVLSGTSGNDSVYNYYGESVTINTGDGDDYVYNYYKSDTVTINTGDGNDSVKNFGSSVTINTGAGNDSVDNTSYGDSVTINTGADNDYVYNLGSTVTINTGAGNDEIFNNCYRQSNGNIYYYTDSDGSNVLFTYNVGDGNDVIYGFKDNSTLSIAGGQYVSFKSGDDVIVTAQDGGKIMLVGAAKLSRVNIVGNQGIYVDKNYDNNRNNVLLIGSDSNNSITNQSFKVSIITNGGNDYVYYNSPNLGHHYSLIDTGDGDDTVGNENYEITINTGDGNDYVWNSSYSESVTINTGAGNDEIFNNCVRQSNGNIHYYTDSDGSNVLFTYNVGDGNDVIYGFKANSTLSITGGVYATTAKSGNDVIVTVGNGKITLQGAASLSTLNIVEKPVNIINDKSNTTIYGTNANDIIINTGDKVTIQALRGNDSINNKAAQVTIDGGAGNDSVSNKGSNVTISGGEGNDSVNNTGNYLSISGDAGDDSINNWGDNVTISGGAGKDSIYNSGENTTLSGGTGDDSISLSSYYAQNNLIQYSSGDGNDLIKGFKANSTLSITGGVYATTAKSGNDVIVTVGDGKITLQGAASLSTLNIVETPVNINNDKSNTTIYGTNANDTIINTGDKVTIQALRGNDSINNKAAQVTIDGGDANDKIYNTGKNVTITAQAGNDSIGNESASVLISGGAGNDSVSNKGSNVTISGGEGNDSIYNNSGSDKVSIAGGAGNDSIYNAGNNVTIDSGAGNNTISSKSTSTSIIAADGNDLIDIQASYKNTIIAGKGSDTIKLDMNSNEAFIQYNLGEGDDVIEGFNATSTLQLGDGNSTYSKSVSGNDAIITVEDGGKVTLKGAATLSTVNIVGVTRITVDNAKSETLISGNRLEDSINNRGSNVTINTFAGKDTVFNYAQNVTIDAGADVDHIANNNASNSSISAGDGDDLIDSKGGYRNTISGGTGNDDIFITSSAEALIQYSEGDGTDYITGFNETSTLQIGNGTVSYYKEIVDNDVIITLNETKITLEGAATLSTVHIVGEEEIAGKNFRNREDNSLVSGTAGDDSIRNNGKQVTIEGLGGNDSIVNNSDSVSIDAGAGKDSLNNEGYDVTIKGGKGDDSIVNDAEKTLFQYEKGDGNDFISGFNETSTLSISGELYSLQTSGNDLLLTVGEGQITLAGAASLSAPNIIGVEDKPALNISNSTDNATVTGGNANDRITNTGSNVKILAYGGDDSIRNNTGENVSIDMGAGNDYIYNYSGSRALISGGDDKDTINNVANYSTILAGKGDDSAYNGGYKVMIDMGDGNDYIESNGRYSTIAGGGGNDVIDNRQDHITFIYNTGDGNDTVVGFRADSTLQIGDGTGAYSTQKSGNDIIVSVSDGKITLQGTATLSSFNISGTEKELAVIINNTVSGSSIIGTEGNDTISNTGKSVTISALEGNDRITNNGSGSQVSITAGDGDDTIANNHAQKVTIAASNGNDSVSNSGNFAMIDGGAGNDSIANDNAFYSSISGAEGDDLISLEFSTDTTLNGGAGNDTITLDEDSTAILVEYKAGDGNDLIQGFNDSSTLSISGAAFSTKASGNDIIVTVGENKITLAGAATLALDELNIISAETASTASVNLKVENAKVSASNLSSANAYQFNQNFSLLNINSASADNAVKVTNAEDSSIKANGSFGSAILSSGNVLEYQLNAVALTSETYNDKISFSKDTTFTYGDIQVNLLAGSVISTKGAKEISFDNNSSANITAPEGAKININSGTFTINNLPVNSTNGAGTITVEKDGLSFKGYGVQFVDLEVAKESYFEQLAPMTVAYNSSDKSYTLQNTASIKTLSNDFTKLTLDISAAEDYAYFEVNDKDFLIASTADNINVVEANDNAFKIQGKELDAEKIGRVTLDEQITFSGTAIDFDGVKVNYALNKPVSYSLDGKEITIDDAATVTTGDETKTITCAAGTYTVNGKSFETTADLTFTADENEIKIPLTDSKTEIHFDGVKVRNGEIVFDLANDKISVSSGATLNVTSPEEVKLNLAAGTFTIDGKKISSATELEITADKDNIKVPLSENAVTINDAAITGTGIATATIDNTDEYFFSILLPDGALVQNASSNIFELSGKDSYACFGDANKKVQLTADGTAYVEFQKANTIGIGFNALSFEQVEILGNDAWTVETSGTRGIDKITGITDGATLTPLTNEIDTGDLRFEVETNGAGTVTICGQKFTSTDDANIYVVNGNSNEEIKVSTLADEYADDDSEAAGKIYQFDAAGDYTVNGITFHAEKGTKAQTITRGVEFDLSSGKFQYDGLTLGGSGSAHIDRYNASLISLTDGATVSSSDESTYQNRQFEIAGAVELIGKKFETDEQIRCGLFNIQDVLEISIGGDTFELPLILSGFVVEDKYVSIKNDCYDTIKIVDKKVTSIEGVKASAKITGSGLSNVTIEATASGEFTIGGKTFKISDDSDGVTFVTDSHGNVAEINGLVGSLESDFENEVSINGKAVRLTGASSIKVTSDGTNITEISNVAGYLFPIDDKTYRKDVRVYELGGAEKLTTSADGTIIFNGNKFEASAGKTFTLDSSGEVVGIAQVDKLLSASVTELETSAENLSTINLSTTDGLEEVFGDFSEGLTVNGVFVRVTDSTNFVVKDDDENVYIETTAADTFRINGKTFTTSAAKTIFKLDAQGNVSEIVTDSFLASKESYLINGDFNDAIIFNGQKYCVTGTNDTSIFIDAEPLISIELARNSVEVVESGGAADISASGAGDITIGGKTFNTSEGFTGFLQVNSAGNVYSSDYFVGTLSGKLGGLELAGITITTDDTFSATGDGEKLTALDNLQDASFTCDDLNGLTINGTEISVANSEELTATISDGVLNLRGLKDSAIVSNTGAAVSYTVEESGEFLIGETEFTLTGDNSLTFTTDAQGIVQKISGLDEGANLKTVQGGTYTVNGKELTAQANGTFIGLANGSAKILSASDEFLRKLIADNADAVLVKENITLSGGDVAVVDDTAARVSITASKSNDTIYSAGDKVSINLRGGATKIQAMGGKATLENYDATTGAALVTDYDDIFAAIKDGDISFGRDKVSIGAAVVNVESDFLNFSDAAGNLQQVGFAYVDSSLNASSAKNDLILVGDSGSTLRGGSGDDSIYAGEDAHIDAGTGRNLVDLRGDGGAIIELSGNTTVTGFTDADALKTSTDNLKLQLDGDNLIAKNDSAKVTLASVAENTLAQLSIVDGGETLKAYVAQDGENISASEAADIYYGKKSGVDFSAYDESLAIDLSKNFNGINRVTVGGGLNTLISSSANETLTSNADGITQFIFDAGAGHDVISNFNFAEDRISVGAAVTNVVLRNSGDVIIQLGDEWITLEDAQGKNFKINEFVAQVDTNITYDDAANYFLATSKNASVIVGEEAEIWLDGSHGKNFVGNIKTLDASTSDGKNTLAGNDNDNIICAGAGDASLWGGNGNDLLVGGKAHNLFFHTSGNDTISGANDGDAVILSNVTLDQISGTNFTASGVAINFAGGGSLQIDSRADITYQLADGSSFSANHEQSTWTPN